jgi:hypothetical protein
MLSIIQSMQFERIEGKDNKAKLKPSEATWITGNLAVGYEHLARRIEKARRLAISPYIRGNLLMNTAELSLDWMRQPTPEARTRAMSRQLTAEIAMVEAEETHAVDENGVEQHTVEVTLSDANVDTIHSAAQSANDAARGKLFGPEITRSEAAVVAASVNAMAFKDVPHGLDMTTIQITEGILQSIEASPAA